MPMVRVAFGKLRPEIPLPLVCLSVWSDQNCGDVLLFVVAPLVHVSGWPGKDDRRRANCPL